MYTSAVAKLFALSVMLVTSAVAQPRAAAAARMAVDLSPDGRTLAFEWRGGIFTVPVGGGRPTRLTSGASGDATPVWSPDGDRIAFVRAEGRRQNVWVVDRQSKRLAAITHDSSGRRIVSLSWSANGGAIALAFGSSAPGFEIVDVATGNPTRFAVAAMGRTSSHAVHAVAVAPDMRSAIIQGGDARANDQQLYRFSFPLRDQRPITEERHGALSPVFSADGNRLAFLTRADSGGLALTIRDVAEARQRVVPVLPPPASPISDSLLELPHYALSRDGSVAFIGDREEIWRVELATGRRRVVPIDLDKP
jgi:dipeptidyl aminopeptidase/acylaminoacyl peptidase